MRYLVITFVLITGVSFAAITACPMFRRRSKMRETITVEYNLPDTLHLPQAGADTIFCAALLSGDFGQRGVITPMTPHFANINDIYVPRCRIPIDRIYLDRHLHPENRMPRWHHDLTAETRTGTPCGGHVRIHVEL